MIIVNQAGYHYVAVGFGGLFLIPQIYLGYKSGSLKDVSTISIIFIFLGSLLWSYYMYQKKYKLYVFLTGFVCLNSFVLLTMQLKQYYMRFKKHVKTFETKDTTNKSIHEKNVNSDKQQQIIFIQKDDIKQRIESETTKEVDLTEKTENEL